VELRLGSLSKDKRSQRLLEVVKGRVGGERSKSAGRVDEMHKIFRILVGPWAELLDLFEDAASALFLVLDLIVFIDDDEEIGFRCWRSRGTPSLKG